MGLIASLSVHAWIRSLVQPSILCRSGTKTYILHLACQTIASLLNQNLWPWDNSLLETSRGEWQKKKEREIMPLVVAKLVSPMRFLYPYLHVCEYGYFPPSKRVNTFCFHTAILPSICSYLFKEHSLGNIISFTGTWNNSYSMI